MHMSENDDAEILARFPGPQVFYPSRRKWLLVFLGGASFAAGGLWMVRTGAAGGWLVLVFFAIVAVVALIVMLPHAGALTLDRGGFEVVNLFRRRRTRWQDASGFTARRIPPARQQFVLYDDASRSEGRLARFNVGLVGRNSALPDTYGRSAESLAQLMEEWRRRAVAER
jgi:hypothetical protein